MFMISVSKQYLEGINSFCILLCMWSHILLLKTATILTLGVVQLSLHTKFYKSLSKKRPVLCMVTALSKI
jgi:hypothetical protein